MKKKKIRVVKIPSVRSLTEMKVDGFNVAYKIGKSAGDDFFEYFIKDIKGKENKIKEIIEILSLTEYGKFELKNISEKSILIKVTKAPLPGLCSKNKDSSFHWFCNWISGVLAGLFNNIDEEWVFERSKCKNLGHPHCEFIGKKKNSISRTPNTFS